MLPRLLFGIALIGYLAIVFPFADHLLNRPVQVKLGYVAEAPILKFLTADQRYLVANSLILKVILYFGELIEKAGDDALYASAPDYSGMFDQLQTGLRIDPYNVDAYYFAQATYVWEVGRVHEVNDMLEYGMRYRTWDFQLPFYAGFNHAYFLKDYVVAADYMRRAAELSKIQVFSTLAARYFHETGRDDLAIDFLKSMKKTAHNDQERKLYDYRLAALEAAREIKEASASYRQKHGVGPRQIEELVTAGFLEKIPSDPYGGKFFLDEKGVLKTTSDFSFAGAERAAREKEKLLMEGKETQ